MTTFTRAGATIAFTDSGAPPTRPDAPAVMFGHGLLFGGWMFEPQIEALHDSYRCVTIDWRGQGETPAAAAGGYDMDTLAKDAATLIKSLGAGSVHWVGLSMGGFVGMRLAARQPSLIRSLSLLSTSAERDAEEVNVSSTQLAGDIRAGAALPGPDALTSMMFSPDFAHRDNHDAVVERWLGALGRTDRQGLAEAILGVVNRAAISGELAAIAAPILVISGEYDVMPQEFGKAIAASVQDGHFESLPGAGHACTLDRPAELTRLLTDFLDAH
jgi:pimeloyl-ACP methyl ester carboxylesterase